MIKLPKEIKDIIGSLKEKRISSYVAGPCVADSIMGKEPLDWDMTAGCSLGEMKDIFPEGKELGEVLRLDFTGEKEDGLIVDIYPYEEDPGEFLRRQEFTVYAMADNPEKGFLDPYEGREDIREKLIRTVGDPVKLFKSDPLAMMRAIIIAAENDFDIHKKTYEAMVECAPLLEDASVDEIRENFCTIIISPYAGKGLRMLAGADLMPAIIGDIATKLSRRQLEQFSCICNNIHKTKQNLKRRLGLFYTALEGKKGEEAMRRLNYDPQTEQNILDGLYLMEKIHFFRSTVDLKEALVAYGPERYEYIDNLAKAQRIVYDTSEAKILMRNALMDDIISKKEPIYVEDLAVDEEKLIRAGIPAERAGEILVMLTDIVHRKPSDNNEKELLKNAKKFARSKFAARTRKVKWLR
ncbi:MAG: hypothetical protein ACOYJU_05420 [Anaerovoracaceae bacterium]